MSASDETFGTSGTLQHETKSKVIVIPEVRSALERVNPVLAADAINAAVDELVRDRRVMSLAASNRETWELLRHSVKVSVPDSKRRGDKTKRVCVVDWDNPSGMS